MPEMDFKAGMSPERCIQMVKESGLKEGEEIFVTVCGARAGAIYCGILPNGMGIRVGANNRRHELYWGDLIRIAHQGA
jgi:hypothetical protein